MLAIFWQFFLLGLMSFGGPAAHIGYFKKRFVDELNWLDANTYASFVALSQVIPGPGSSQVGFAIGYHRFGLLGGIAAFLGFTSPSFVLLFSLAVSSDPWLNESWFNGLIHGLKLMAVVVVFDAVLSMYNQFCRKLITRIIMMLAAIISLSISTLWSQLGILFIAGAMGYYFLSPRSLNATLQRHQSAQSIKFNYKWLVLFVLLFAFSLLFIDQNEPMSQLFAQFYQAGALVFGGGHVVLPLLEMTVGQNMTSERFLTGYAMAQAVPGPMFSIAAFLGAELLNDTPLLGAVIATIAIFLPGFLLFLAVCHSWQSSLELPSIQGGISGINAAVVGLLVTAFVTPVMSSALTSLVDVLIVLIGFSLLKLFRLNIMWLLFIFSLLGISSNLTLLLG
ncbi:chromate efflux transporter [Shewanella psychrotolerans]|uniref:chromate efflux transporter n=1 Tax=Shewanella psychrotolerans TaxID=2864206 RepID=UPI001C659A65|nr:chromate efflux transporter [Shewanella psychrotolerans]QYK02100.1 chromate efflux transporter [Shewanella psychrotolerans]